MNGKRRAHGLISRIIAIIMCVTLVIPYVPAVAVDAATSSEVHNFTTDGKSSNFFSITGNLSTSKGTVKYNGLTLTRCLKMESSTNVSFTASAKGTLTLVFVETSTSKVVKVDGTSYTSDSNGVVTVSVSAGSHTITKANTSNLFYMAYASEGSSSSGSTGSESSTEAATESSTQAPTTDTSDAKYTLYVGSSRTYKTINAALDAVDSLNRSSSDRVVIMIDPGNYEEMLVIDQKNITLKNSSSNPSTALKNKGVNIDSNAVRITWYYGHGYTYYSMGSDYKYSASVLKTNKSNGKASVTNPGAGSATYWNASVVVKADGFAAEGIIFENSFNQYVSSMAANDVIEKQSSAKEGSTTRGSLSAGSTKVQEKEYVERAAALAIANNVKEADFLNCKFIGRQDTLYGGKGATAVFEKCSVYGGTDYIFGGMKALFYQCNLVANTSDLTSTSIKNDKFYITAPQQASGRGYLFYECRITSTTPGVDTASSMQSKPGYFGRPWAKNTGEAVFYKTTIEKTNFSTDGKGTGNSSLIVAEGWLSTLGGESALCGEYGTIDLAGASTSKRASWAQVFTKPQLADGTPIAVASYVDSSWLSKLLGAARLTNASAHTHSYSSSVTTAATCTTAGVKTYKCSCGASYTESIAATGHSYTSSVTKAATCIQTGVRTYSCSCGDSYTESIAKTAHSYSSEYTVDVEATATTEGSKSRHCTTEGCTAKTDITVIPATGSTDSGNTGSDNTGSDNTGSDITSDVVIFQNGTSNQTYSTSDATWLLDAADDAVITLKYTCSDATHGYWGILGWGAVVDGAWYDGTMYSAKPTATDIVTVTCTVAELKSSLKITDNSTVGFLCLNAYNGGTILSLTLSGAVEEETHTHSYIVSVSKEATCMTIGVKVYKCTCGDYYTETIEKTAHNYSANYTVDVEATETTDGSKSRHCTVSGCAAKTDVTVIPATGVEEEPSTGSGSDSGEVTTGASYVQNFTADGKSSDFFSITGNLSTSKGTVKYDGLTLTRCLKMESSTVISFTAETSGVLTLVFVETNKDKAAKVDGTSYKSDSNGIVTVSLSAGSHTIKKGNTANLFYMTYVTEGGSTGSGSGSNSDSGSESHSHSYSSKVTKAATCIATGVKTYTCSCGASYTETIAKTAHNYSSSYTVDVAATSTTDGSQSRHCTTSGCTAKTDVQTIPATGSGSSSGSSLSGVTITAGGWNESLYATFKGLKDSDITGISYSGTMSGSLTGDALKYLVRDVDGVARVDIPGLKAGTYSITVKTSKGSATKSGIKVEAYDRSGYAHFNYTSGVGAYNDDGTLKSNAIVLYVTNDNKNSVSVTSKDGTTVTGIGNILNSSGKDVGTGKTSKGGTPNSNNHIIEKLAKDGTPLVVRIIGSVKAPSGLTAYDSVDYGGSVGDNGYMARMHSGMNITIEGIGNDAQINGWGIHFMALSGSPELGKSFEVRNISFVNVPEDCVGMEGVQEGSTLTASVERCWIHHCNFYAPSISNPAESDKSGGDGACDFKRGQYFTNSYCYYESYHKTNLVGGSDSNLQYHLTYHHNYWYKCESRGPLARQADIHMYNNYFNGQTSYCMNPRANAYIFSEYNIFNSCKNPMQVKLGGIKSFNDTFTNCKGDMDGTEVSSKSTKVSTDCKYANFDTNSSVSYVASGNYILDTSVTANEIIATAGTMK